MGGYIYWVGAEKFPAGDGSYTKTYMIVSFDLSTHHFQVINIPEQLTDVLPSPFNISHLGDSLVLFGTFCVGDIILLSAWVLMVDGDSVTSYTMLFSIPTSHSVLLVGFTNNDMPIVEVDELGYQLAHTLQVYDPISQEFYAMGMEGDGGSFYIGPFKESLLLLYVFPVAKKSHGLSFSVICYRIIISFDNLVMAKLPEVMDQAGVFQKKGIDPTTYNISFRNVVDAPKQGGVFGDCGIWTEVPATEVYLKEIKDADKSLNYALMWVVLVRLKTTMNMQAWKDLTLFQELQHRKKEIRHQLMMQINEAHLRQLEKK
ncbi:hypothetical protein Tco_0231665 [Tanacetum coccineum]